MTHYAKVIGTGSYLPEHVMTNADLEALVETSDEWIRERTGIRQRHIAAPDETTSDLAERASRRALAAAEVAVEDLDLIIVATTTADKIFPSVACLLQARLGAPVCTAFDLQAVCTGFIYAMGVAHQFFRAGAARCALVVGAETMSRIVNWQDRSTCVLFGDGAGAVVLKASDEPGILSTHMHADGQYERLLHVPAGVSHEPARWQAGEAFLEMRGNEVFRMAVTALGRMVDETLDANGLGREDIDWLVPHQANERIIQATARKLRMSTEQVVMTVAEHGNTSSASVPLALDAAVRDGRITPGQTVLMEAFGGGFTWGSVLLRT